MDGTRDYERKRDLDASGEPAGGPRRRSGEPVFVVQRHDASSLHYDLRLEVDGALASWAVPKGPSTDPRERRLALRTEDHPLDYAGFEGVIPAGHYGAGTVIVWDRGTYRNLRAAGATEGDGDDDAEAEAEDVSMADALADGQVEVWLEGEKLRGGWALVRTGSGDDDDDDDDDERWLLVKMKDAGADARRNPTSTQPESVLSGRTSAEVARAEDGGDGDDENDDAGDDDGAGGDDDGGSSR